MSDFELTDEVGAPVFGTQLEPENELFTINLGPHHPATHGVLRLLCTMEGEYIREMKPIIGYLHTGIEKSCEDQSYWKVIPFIERMDYLAYYFNAMAYCMAVEKLVGLEVGPRRVHVRIRGSLRVEPIQLMRSLDVPLSIVLIVARIHEDNQPHFTARIVEEQRSRLRVRGFDPVTAGILLSPLAIGLLVLSPISGAIADRSGSRRNNSG